MLKRLAAAAILAALTFAALTFAAPANAEIVQTGTCTFEAVPREANSVTAIDGFIIRGATYPNAVGFWYSTLYRPAWLAGTYTRCQVVTSVSVHLPVSGTVGQGR